MVKPAAHARDNPTEGINDDGRTRARDHRRPAGRAHRPEPRARCRLRGVDRRSRRCARSWRRRPTTSSASSTATGCWSSSRSTASTCRRREVKETGARRRRPAGHPAAGRRRLTPPAGRSRRRAPAARCSRRRRCVAPGLAGYGAVVTTTGGPPVKLWATRETRTELLMACLRVVMGAIFLAVWSDNLIKGYYSPSGWARLRAALRRHDQGERLRPPAELGDDPALDRLRVRAVRDRVRRLRPVPGARRVHAGLGPARGAVPAEPAGRDVGDHRLARHLHHHGRAAARRQPLAGGPDARAWTRCWRDGTRTRGCRSTDAAGRQRRA